MSTTTVKQTIGEKMACEIEEARQACIKDIQQNGGFPPLMVFYDDKGQGHLGPVEIDMFLEKPAMKSVFIAMMKSFIRFVKEQDGTNLVKSVIFQNVYYVSGARKDGIENSEDYLKKHGSVSKDPESEQGVMVLTETAEELSYKVYHAVYDKEETTGVVSEEPVQDHTFKKGDKDTMESWMIGIFD